jgi:small multidrug resistance pump
MGRIPIFSAWREQMAYLYLFVAIVTEVVGTLALKATEGFTKLVPSLIVIAGYAVSFYFVSLALKSMSIGVAYAIWSGVGLALVAIAGMVLYKQLPDLAALVGILLILAGVVVINLFSKTVLY